MRRCTCLLVAAVLFTSHSLVAGEYVLRVERLAARGWRGKPEDGQVLLRYELTVHPEVPFRCGLAAGSDRLNLSGVVTPHADGHVDLSLNTQVSIAGNEEESSAESEGWSNRLELSLNLDEPATVAPTFDNEWKLRTGKRINSRSVARERIRVLLVESPRATDQGLQLAAASGADPADAENFTVRISQMSPAVNASGKGTPSAREQLALFFDTRPGVSTIVRCAFGTTECFANSRIEPSQSGRIRADTTIAFKEHDKSFSPDKVDQPHDILRQLSARTTVHTKLGELTSIGESPRSPGQAGSSGLCIRIDARTRK